MNALDTYTQSPAATTDLAPMAALAQGFPERHLHSADLPYRLTSWGLEDPQNTCLWHEPDSRLGAFCIGWLAAQPSLPPVGQIEPLGCHPDFRRYGLGRIALAEVLRRLADCGAERIRVETDNTRSTARSLYESLGFEIIKEVRIYRKDYEPN